LIDTNFVSETSNSKESVGTRLSEPANEKKEVCQCERQLDSKSAAQHRQVRTVEAVIQFTGGML